MQSAFISNFVGWPLAITVIGLAVIALAITAVIVARMFRPQIADFANRRFGGVNVNEGASDKNAPQKEQTPPFPDKVLKATDIGKIPEITEQEAAIRRDIEAEILCVL